MLDLGNGYISFAPAPTGFPTPSVTDVLGGVPRIMSYYTDLIPSPPAGRIYYQQFAQAGERKMKIAHERLAEFGGTTGPHGGEMVIAESGDIHLLVPTYNGAISINTVVGITPGGNIDPGGGPGSTAFRSRSVRRPDRTEPLQHPHSFGLVLVMSALFLLFILLATASLLVFCRKKNTVFVATHAPLCKANHFSRYRYASAEDGSVREAYELESCSNVFSDDDCSTCTADDTRTDAGTCRQHLPSDAPSESASLLPSTPAHSEHRLSLPVVTNFIDLLAYADDSDSDASSADSAYCTQNCLDSCEISVPPNLTELFQARAHPAQNSATSPSVAVTLQEVGVVNDTFDSVSTHSDVMSMTSSPQRQTTTLDV